MIEGHAVPVTDPAELARVQAAADEKNQRIGSGTEALPGYFSESRQRRLDRGDRIMVKIPMERVRTWDFGKAKQHYEKAAAGQQSG